MHKNILYIRTQTMATFIYTNWNHPVYSRKGYNDIIICLQLGLSFYVKFVFWRNNKNVRKFFNYPYNMLH